MKNSLDRALLTGLAALAMSGCQTAQTPSTEPEPSDPSHRITYVDSSGEHVELPDGLVLPTPKWFAGSLEVRSPEEVRLDPGEGASVTDYGVSDAERTAILSYTGSESERAVGSIDERNILARASPDRVGIEGSSEFYDAVSVGRLSTPETQSDLEDIAAGLVGGTEFFGENRFYAVLGKDEEGNYNTFHSHGAIAGPTAVRNALEELYDCARGDLDEVRVRVLPGNFSGPETTYGAVFEAYAGDGECIAQMLVGDREDLAPIAQRASQLAAHLAPQASASTYLRE